MRVFAAHAAVPRRSIKNLYRFTLHVAETSARAVVFVLAVISVATADQTGADQTNLKECMLRVWERH